MTNQPHAFKHRDILRVVKAARAAGLDVGQVKVDPNSGEITVGPAPGGDSTVLTGQSAEMSPLEQWRTTRGKS